MDIDELVKRLLVANAKAKSALAQSKISNALANVRRARGFLDLAEDTLQWAEREVANQVEAA